MYICLFVCLFEDNPFLGTDQLAKYGLEAYDQTNYVRAISFYTEAIVSWNKNGVKKWNLFRIFNQLFIELKENHSLTCTLPRAVLLNCQKIHRFQKGNPKASYYRELGKCYWKNNDLVKAMSNYHTALQKDPDDTDCRTHLALILIRTGNFDEAIKREIFGYFAMCSYRLITPDVNPSPYHYNFLPKTF